MSKKVIEKVEYDKQDDKIVLDAIEHSETLAEAFRKASERINSERGKKTTPERITSRYYSHIKPHYVEGTREIEEVSAKEDKVFSSNGPSNPQLSIILELATALPVEDKKHLIKSLVYGLNKAS